MPSVSLASRSHRLPRRFPRHLRRAQAGMTLLEIMIVLAILALVMGLLVGPKVMAMFRSSKGKTTAIQLHMLAFDAYPQWASSHPEKGCPDKLEELTAFMNQPDIKDAWGTPLVMRCGSSAPAEARGFGVESAGEDQKMGTPDDLHSW